MVTALISVEPITVGVRLNLMWTSTPKTCPA